MQGISQDKNAHPSKLFYPSDVTTRDFEYCVWTKKTIVKIFWSVASPCRGKQWPASRRCKAHSEYWSRLLQPSHTLESKSALLMFLFMISWHLSHLCFPGGTFAMFAPRELFWDCWLEKWMSWYVGSFNTKKKISQINSPGFVNLKVATLCCSSPGRLSNSFCIRTLKPGCLAVVWPPWWPFEQGGGGCWCWCWCWPPRPPVEQGAGGSVTDSRISWTVRADLSGFPMVANMGTPSLKLGAPCFGPKFLGSIEGVKIGAPSLSTTPRKPSILVRLDVVGQYFHEALSAFFMLLFHLYIIVQQSYCVPVWCNWTQCACVNVGFSTPLWFNILSVRLISLWT